MNEQKSCWQLLNVEISFGPLISKWWNQENHSRTLGKYLFLFNSFLRFIAAKIHNFTRQFDLFNSISCWSSLLDLRTKKKRRELETIQWCVVHRDASNSRIKHILKVIIWTRNCAAINIITMSTSAKDMLGCHFTFSISFSFSNKNVACQVRSERIQKKTQEEMIAANSY